MRFQKVSRLPHLRLGLGLCLCLWGAACKPSWEVFKEAPQGTFQPTSHFYLRPLSFEELTVNDDTEEAYLRPLLPSERKRWLRLKAWLAHDYRKGLLAEGKALAISTERAYPSSFQIRPITDILRFGFSTPYRRQNSWFRLRLQILRGEALIEEIQIDHSTSSEIVAEAELRLRKDAYRCGQIAATYLLRRIHGASASPEDEKKRKKRKETQNPLVRSNPAP